MREIYTLRGEIDFTGAGFQEIQLFNYESNNLKQGWIVKDFRIWDGNRTRSGGSGTTSAPNYDLLKIQLQTDTIGVSEFQSAGENRAFGWGMHTYGVTGGSPFNQASLNESYILDPDHMITRELWANFGYESGAGQEQMPCTISYLIVLERVATTPAENILQQVKSFAQDVLN